MPCVLFRVGKGKEHLTEEAAEGIEVMCRSYCNWSTNGCTCSTPPLGITDLGKCTFGRRNIHRYYFSREKQKRKIQECSIADYCDLPELMLGCAAGQAYYGGLPRMVY